MPKIPLEMPAVLWGGWSSDRSTWTIVACTGGSGMVPSWPELRRCGWGICQQGNNGMPVRGAYGGLAGPIQT
eukprot:5697363-Pyramimonas_sp.AAC.1